MNPEQQRDRFSATQRLEKRLEDLELVVDAQTALILKQKGIIDQDLQVFNERLRVYAEREAARINAALDEERAYVNAFLGRAFWRRLRWNLRGY